MSVHTLCHGDATVHLIFLLFFPLIHSINTVPLKAPYKLNVYLIFLLFSVPYLNNVPCRPAVHALLMHIHMIASRGS